MSIIIDNIKIIYAIIYDSDDMGQVTGFSGP